MRVPGYPARTVKPVRVVHADSGRVCVPDLFIPIEVTASPPYVHRIIERARGHAASGEWLTVSVTSESVSPLTTDRGVLSAAEKRNFPPLAASNTEM